MNVEISRKAAQDIEDIWLYTVETWSREQADRYYKLIFDEIDHIVANPLSGRSVNHIRRSYRCLKVTSHLIFYKYIKSEKKVEIIRVLHQSMDIEERL
jgi:toxin ParE1/3/4